MPAETMRFQTKDYPIYVGDAGHSWTDRQDAAQYSGLLLLADEHTRQHCLPVLQAKLPAVFDQIPVAVIPAGEAHKQMDTCAHIWQAMLDARLDRNALVVNLGGGVIGDMGGFCAATWKRGVHFIQMPTTLLSMTDAAIGGKLGIDFQGIKNSIGVFQNPAAVIADPDFLATLPYRELRSGFAEVIKHAFIGDPALLARLQAMPSLEDLDSAAWYDILCASIAVKVRVVEEDPFEKGLRMILNYGHTIGHAVESYFLDSPAPLTHGEAIAVGMLTESYLAYGEGPQLDAVCQLVARFFPMPAIPVTAHARLWDLMLQDKKNTHGAVRMALPGAEPYELTVHHLDYAALERSMAFYAQFRTAHFIS